jgi:hypothetical protein
MPRGADRTVLPGGKAENPDKLREIGPEGATNWPMPGKSGTEQGKEGR